jgi:hypothetical protein
MIFYLGCHQPLWLERASVPWFLSYQKLKKRKKPVAPAGRWALDCGGFTEIDKFGEYTFTPQEYARDVVRFKEWGGLDFCASMDFPCSPLPLEKSGLTMQDHQRLTVENFQVLREVFLGDLVKPVLQGWEPDDYLRHIEQYADAGYDLTTETPVFIGSLVRGSGTTNQVTSIVRRVADQGLQLHALGVKGQALVWLSQVVYSADSMAWASAARSWNTKGADEEEEVETLGGGSVTWKKNRVGSVMLPQCQGKHVHCGSCIDWALVWYEQLTSQLGQMELFT